MSLLLTLTEGGTERTVRARSAVRFPEENNSHFLHLCLVVNECNSQLHHQTKKTVRLEMRLCFKEDKKTVWLRGLFLPHRPFEYWTKLFIVFIAFCVLLTVIYILRRILAQTLWSVGMKLCFICGTRLWFLVSTCCLWMKVWLLQQKWSCQCQNRGDCCFTRYIYFGAKL